MTNKSSNCGQLCSKNGGFAKVGLRLAAVVGRPLHARRNDVQPRRLQLGSQSGRSACLAPRATAPSPAGEDFSSAMKNAPSSHLGRFVRPEGRLNQLLNRTASRPLRAARRGSRGGRLFYAGGARPASRRASSSQARRSSKPGTDVDASSFLSTSSVARNSNMS